MRKLNNKANVQLIGAAVAILVTIMVSILIVFNIASSLNIDNLDDDLNASNEDKLTYGSEYVANATIGTLDQTETFYVLAPLIVIVLVAVTILGYIMMIGGKKQA